MTLYTRTVRTDQFFKDRKWIQQKSPLNPWEQLALGIMSQFPIDYMHVVLLGVTRKLLILWKNGDTSKKVSTKFRLSDKMFEQISTRWYPLGHPRTRFCHRTTVTKATELRTISCFTSCRSKFSVVLSLGSLVSLAVYSLFNVDSLW